MARYRQAERLARYRKRRKAGYPVVVSEGDSWLSYEFFPNIVDLIDDQELFAHLRLEMSGDTVANMVGSPAAIEALRQVVVEEEAIFLLFSGGGNDIQRAAETLFRNAPDPAECIKVDVAERLFGDMKEAYERLIETVGPHVPVVSHGYDWFRPSDEPVRALGMDIKIGPWIYPEMMKSGVCDPELQLAVAKLLVDRFNHDLKQLEESHPRDFVYIDLRGTLDLDHEWENEIHPTRRGFQKVTDKLLEGIYGEVRPLLQDRR